ncbi:MULTISPECIES: hypothetical protein [Corallococcus]|uniref:hypothetical protein n=1 Tax=Corallococcus TaxID=83461 RepID=UPI001180DD5B|nr:MULTISPECIES: hypothetical protein [Corallococcus]NBD09144.1 hypothetical protein [Corallococcus silvisoli]TSC31174.1 hypothetical protein FOF48_10750 [Corallococcus sp. Z5C101001]
MTTFLDALVAFPTAIFTILLGVTLAYWLCVIIGAVGIDLLDGDLDLEGGAKAVSGAFEGGAKATSGMLEGGAKAVSGHGHSHLHDAEAATGLLAALGFGGIPVTVSVSLVVFLSWSLSLVSGQPTHAALSMLPSWLVSTGLGLVCAAVGLVVGGLAVRPLRPIFIAKRAPGRDALMGRVCIISSGSVTAKDGHATFDDGAAGLILNVFCDKPNQLKRGQPALILGYDAERGVYEVEPVDWLLPQELEQLRDPLKAAAIARARAQR